MMYIKKTSLLHNRLLNNNINVIVIYKLLSIHNTPILLIIIENRLSDIFILYYLIQKIEIRMFSQFINQKLIYLLIIV